MRENHVELMRFIDGSHSFVMGFECGKIWEGMRHGEGFSQLPVHACNKMQITMMADHHGYEYEFSTMDEQWTAFSGKPIDISGLSEPEK